MESVIESTPAAIPEPDAPRENVALPPDGFVLNEATLVNSPLIPYVRMVASVIERRTISREELVAALLKSMRQHRIGRRPRREYVLDYLNQHQDARAPASSFPARVVIQDHIGK